MRESFIFYESFLEALDELDETERLALYDAITHYALREKEPKLKGALMALFKIQKRLIDANNAKYEAAKKGGRVRADKAKETQASQSHEPAMSQPCVSHTSAIDKASAGVNVNVNDNVLDVVNNAPAREDSIVLEFKREIHTPSPNELMMIDEWEKEHPPDVIRAAIFEAVKHGGRNGAYINAVLSAWKRAGVRTAADARAQTSTKKRVFKKTNAHYEDQREGSYGKEVFVDLEGEA